jgi:hypothetical protein
LTHEDIGNPINEGSTKVAYTLKNHPDLLFLQLGENPGESDYIERIPYFHTFQSVMPS